MGTYFYTSDEHVDHCNIIKYCNRPFVSVEEMNVALRANHNAIVAADDWTIHVGDFTLSGSNRAIALIEQLNGRHIFLRGSHDKWQKQLPHDKLIDGKWLIVGDSVYERQIDGLDIVACHYAMRKWPRSHYGSIQLYGHSHGNLPPEGLQYDVGVDSNGYAPISITKIKEIINAHKTSHSFANRPQHAKREDGRSGCTCQHESLDAERDI